MDTISTQMEDNNSETIMDNPVKKLKVNQSEEIIIQSEGTEPAPLKRISDHIESLSYEEGAILIEKWDQTNYADFGAWLRNSCAQATFQIEEKVSFNSKPSKNKTVQIKNFQCHLQVIFADPELQSLVSNGFGKSKKEAKRLALKQMITFLIQKDLIKYGLKEKAFLYKKPAKIPTFREEAERRCLAPEEEKKSRECKIFIKDIQESLDNHKFDDACKTFMKLMAIKKPEWNEVSYLWTYAVKHRNTRYIKIILDLITTGKVESPDQENDAITSNYVERMKRTQGALINQYGHSRLRVKNPYELFDHNSVEYENENTLDSEQSVQVSDIPDSFEDIKLTCLSTEDFKDILM